MQMTKLGSTANHLPTLKFRYTAGVLIADINQLSSLPNQLFAQVRLSTATSDRLVSQRQSRIDKALVLNRNEEPFTLADERFVASAVPLPWLYTETIFECPNRSRLECVEGGLHR